MGRNLEPTNVAWLIKNSFDNAHVIAETNFMRNAVRQKVVVFHDDPSLLERLSGILSGNGYEVSVEDDDSRVYLRGKRLD